MIDTVLDLYKRSIINDPQKIFKPRSKSAYIAHATRNSGRSEYRTIIGESSKQSLVIVPCVLNSEIREITRIVVLESPKRAVV